MEETDLGDNPTVIADWLIDIAPVQQIALITWGRLDPNSRQPVPLHPPQVWTIPTLQRLLADLPVLIQTLKDCGGRGMQ